MTVSWEVFLGTRKVLIVAKCNVNVEMAEYIYNKKEVLIVAKCNVNDSFLGRISGNTEGINISKV